jgi:hypothetical protein
MDDDLTANELREFHGLCAREQKDGLTPEEQKRKNEILEKADTIISKEISEGAY